MRVGWVERSETQRFLWKQALPLAEATASSGTEIHHMKSFSSFVRDACWIYGTNYTQRRYAAYFRNTAALLIWLYVSITIFGALVGSLYFVTIFGTYFVVAIQENRKCRELSKQPFPLDIRKRLYRDGTAFLYYEKLNIPELREYQRQLIFHRLLLMGFIVFVTFLGLPVTYRLLQ